MENTYNTQDKTNYLESISLRAKALLDKIDITTLQNLPVNQAIIILTLALSNKSYIVQVKEDSCTKALSIAIGKLLSTVEFINEYGLLRIDLVIKLFDKVTLRSDSNVTLYNSNAGLLFDINNGVAITTEELLSKGIINKNGITFFNKLLKLLSSKDNSISTSETRESIDAYPFECLTIIENTSSHLSSLAYNNYLKVQPLDRKTLQNKKRESMSYLAKHINDDGSFDYIYNPVLDTCPDDYNLVRHAGTLYSMYQMLRKEPNEYFFDQAEKARKFLIEHIQVVNINAVERTCVVEANQAKLGGTALALVALVEGSYVNRQATPLSLLQKLGDYIVSQQNTSGKFLANYLLEEQQYFEPNHIYYIGQAILALVRLYKLDKNSKWLKSAELAAKFMINERKEIPIEKLPLDHWFMIVLPELYILSPCKEFQEHMRNLAESMFVRPSKSFSINCKYSRHKSAFKGTPTATKIEGLAAVAYLEASQKNKLLAKRYLSYIEKAIRLILDFQLTANNSMYFASPQLALGGFKPSQYDFAIRIDFVQHALSALIAFEKARRAFFNKNK